MDSIVIKYIFEDIFSDIKNVNYSVEDALIFNPPAITSPKRRVIFYNSNCISLYTLAEEYIHARQHHHRRCDGYDVRNPDEIEAHHLAIDYLITLCEKYDCPHNWQQFMIATGTPDHLRDYVIERYNDSPDGVLFKTAL